MIMYNVFFSLPLFFPTCWFYSFELVLFYAYVSFVSFNQKEQQRICVEFNCVTPKSVHLYVDVDVTCLHESDFNFMFLSPNVASYAIPSHVLNRMICMNVQVCVWIWDIGSSAVNCLYVWPNNWVRVFFYNKFTFFVLYSRFLVCWTSQNFNKNWGFENRSLTFEMGINCDWRQKTQSNSMRE